MSGGPKVGDVVVGGRCPNPNCVTGKEREPVRPAFRVVEEAPLLLECVYCDRIFEAGQIEGIQL